MIKSNYTSKYLKIYFWKLTAMILRFISMFIVIPFLTKDPSIYGVYAFSISVIFFLGYADLGFLNAGQKYAAECVANDKRSEEMEFIGFGSYILLLFTLLFSLVFFYFGFNPHALIKGLDNYEKVSTATNLFFIIAFFAPVNALQRTVSMIFDIRLDSHKIQRITIFSSLISILSVFYFFKNGKYEIVSYFLFSQIVNLLFVIIALLVAKRLYDYDIKIFIKKIRWNLSVYRKVKSLSFSGLYVMILWILFYELDSIIIGKTLGVQKVAVYSIAFSFASLFRSIFAILFSPFVVRLNYFISNGDEQGLNNFVTQLFFVSAPLVVFPTVALALVSRPLILTWVGNNYVESIDLMRCFVLGYSLSFISYTFSALLYVKSGVKEMYALSTIQTSVYWIGVFFSFSTFGLLSFGIFKLIAVIISEYFYFKISTKYLMSSTKELFFKVFRIIFLPLLFLIFTLYLASNFLPTEKSSNNLFIVIALTGGIIALSYLMLYFTSSNVRILVKKILDSL